MNSWTSATQTGLRWFDQVANTVLNSSELQVENIKYRKILWTYFLVKKESLESSAGSNLSILYLDNVTQVFWLRECRLCGVCCRGVMSTTPNTSLSWWFSDCSPHSWRSPTFRRTFGRLMLTLSGTYPLYQCLTFFGG